MEILKLIIPKEATSFYKDQLGADPWVEFQPVPGDDNFIQLEIDEPIDMDIEKIAEAAENYGFQQGWAAACAHHSFKNDK